MTADEAAFIQSQTKLTPLALIPELSFYLAVAYEPLWLMIAERLRGGGDPPPFWAIAWPGGEGMARYLLDHPEMVRGCRVLDFAAGCGVAAIAAMKAGAKSALAVDIDPLALEATRMNAAANGVKVETAAQINLRAPFAKADVILVGDAFYDQAMSTQLQRFLWLCFVQGTRIVVADPGRAYAPREGMQKLADYRVPVPREFEGEDFRTVSITQMISLPDE
jgi:predicted nicotinamide N-methyase